MNLIRFTDGTYDMIFDGDLKVEIIESNQTYDFNYFMNVKWDELSVDEFNLVVHTHMFIQTISRKHMTSALKNRLKELEEHLRSIVEKKIQY
ncbi:hypothetical protein [Cohnella soli]|uniref:Uncharacterized protein n=1 Tax=Cohnella soli TaxID=425005 RepID=A0ABW0HLQ9_9BACL